MSNFSIGIDFGTTNSSVARATRTGRDRAGAISVCRRAHGRVPLPAYLEQVRERGVSSIKSWSGPEAIEAVSGGRDEGPADPVAEVVPEQPQPEEHGRLRAAA